MKGLGCTCILLFVLFAAWPAHAQTAMEGGARAAALGGAATALSADVWGHGNPASWSTLPGRAISFFATEAFGLSELRLGAAQYAEPTRFGTFSLGARIFGFEDYRETRFLAGYARGFSLGTARRIHAGIRLRFHQVSIPEYGQASALGLALGGLVNILPNLDLGFQATNFHNPKLAGDDALDRSLSLGLAYSPAEQLLIVADAFQDTDFPLSFRGGVEVQAVSALVLRAGFTTEPKRFTAGAGLRMGKLAADVAGENHEVLGWSPAISFGVQW